MDCCAICTASSYNTKHLFHSLKSRYNTSLIRDVVHIEDENGLGGKVDVFFFPYGATICWGIPLTESGKYLEEVKEFQEQELAEIESDDFTYSYDEKVKMIDDDISLPDDDPLTKLAVSHALAQSVKLGAFENMISKVFARTRHIPECLAKYGKVPLSRKEIRKRMGELFIDRSSINLHTDVLDTPEFFWDHTELELLYSTVAIELDIETRGQVLNQRLDVVRELFEMLGNELNHQHSSRLEWIIIWLILIEVIITLSTHYHLV